MQLKDVLYQMMQESQAAQQPTELCTGTVTSASPLEITVDTAMAPLRSPVLYLTSAVVEKKIPILEHTHEVSGLSHTHSAPEGTTGNGLTGSYPTEPALTEIACLENGEPLPVEGGYILLNRALQAGDRVLLMRVQHGQQFIVLSRIFEGGGA